MIPRHHPTSRKSPDPKPVRCLRHGVWMASCDDCCAARAELVKAARQQPARPAR